MLNMLKYVKYVVHFWWRFQQNWLLASKATQSNSFLVCLFVFKSCPVCTCVSHSVMSSSLQAARLICLWNSPGKKTGVDSHSLLQGIFPTQGLNLDLLHCRQILYHLSHHCGLWPVDEVKEVLWFYAWGWFFPQVEDYIIKASFNVC